jgi:hypothetical protein
MTVYQIRIKGHLDQHRADSFPDLNITQLPNGETTLTGPVVDQSALYGVLINIRDLGIPLLSVTEVTQTTKSEETNDD